MYALLVTFVLTFKFASVILEFESVCFHDMYLVLSLISLLSFNHSLAIIFELIRLGVSIFKCIVPVAFV